MVPKKATLSIFAFSLMVAGVNASTDFEACQRSIQMGESEGTIGLDPSGHPVQDISQTKGVNYTTCLRVCGSGTEPFDWSTFSQQFNAWLIPWLALVSQLPVGATNHLDNLISVLLAIGSPALAAYSLVMTLLNNRWLERCLANVQYPNARRCISVFSALQHIPVHLHTGGPLLPSLIVLPENQGWWTDMAERTEQMRHWNIPAAVNVAWVFVAFIFTIADSFNDLDVIHSHGHAVAAVWMWLLPIVIGWLRVGSQTDANHLRDALRHGNAQAYVATQGSPSEAGKNSERRAIEHDSHSHISRVRRDEQREVPIFNYARIFFWSQATEHVIRLYRTAEMKAADHITVNGSEWHDSDHGRDGIHDCNRTGNADQVIQYLRSSYCAPDEWGKKVELETPMGPRWAPGIAGRMILAMISALFLQWCTAGAALLITILTPTTGLGCRSMAYLVYGSVATLSLFCFIISSLLAHASRPAGVDNLRSRGGAVRYLAIAFRWIGKTLAIINAVGIIVACMAQFANVYSNCYCFSAVISRGKDKAFALFLNSDDLIYLGTRDIWVGGVGMALAASVVYGFFIYVAAPSPRR